MKIAEHGPDLASLQELVDSVPALIHTARPDGYIDFFNQRWLEYVGLRLEDLEGWKWTAAVHPDDVSALVAKWRACLASGEPFEFESRVRRADGAYRWMWHQKLALRNAAGEIVKWYGSSVDIDDRKIAEKALRVSEEKFRLVVESIDGLVSTLTPEGEVDFVNRQVLEYFGKTFDQLKNWQTSDALHPDDFDRVVALWAN